MSGRMEKVNGAISQELGTIVGKLFSGGDRLVTVTAVETSPDLQYADCWVSVIPDTAIAWQAVEEALPQLQQHLAGRLSMKRTPKLRIRKDHGAAHAGRIAQLLKQ